MTVAIIFSLTNGGSAMADPLDHGSAAAGADLSDQEIFIRHDGTNQITDVGFYAAEKSGSYGGGSSAAADLVELLAWGDGAVAADFGGFLINMDATGGYLLDWPTFDDKSGTTYNVFRTGAGDSAANKIVLATAMGLTGAPGTIQIGDTPNVRFKTRISVPTSEGTVGVRQFNTKIRYTYTS